MKRIEQLALGLSVLAILMKLALISGGDELLGISLTSLAVLYYPLGIFYFNDIPIGKIFNRDAYKAIKFSRRIGTVGGGIIFSILTVGMLFKFLQLPGAGEIQSIGLTGGGLFLILVLIKYLGNRENVFYKNMVVRTLVIIGISGVLVATPGLTLVKVFHRDNPEYVDAYEAASLNPNDSELQRKAEEIRMKELDEN